MTKQQLRKHYLQKRKSIEPKEKLRLDDMLLLQLQKIDCSNFQTVLTYWGMQQNNEPNTHLFNAYLRHFISELQLAFPVTDFSNNTMQAIGINEDTIYITNEYGITEPKNGNVIKPEEFDLVIVPMIICDSEGYRVGYGKGFYDKFLKQCNDKVVTIGFNYFEPVHEIEDVQEHDMPLCCCITPKEIYEF